MKEIERLQGQLKEEFEEVKVKTILLETMRFVGFGLIGYSIKNENLFQIGISVLIIIIATYFIWYH